MSISVPRWGQAWKLGNQMSSWVRPLCPVGQNSPPRAPQVSAVRGRWFLWCWSMSWESLAKWCLMPMTSFNGHTKINKTVNLANLFYLEEINIIEKNIIIFSFWETSTLTSVATGSVYIPIGGSTVFFFSVTKNEVVSVTGKWMQVETIKVKQVQ